MIQQLLLFALVPLALAAQDTMVVPKQLLNYILQCKETSLTGAATVPVYQTDISSSGTTAHISLVHKDELEDSLRKTVQSDSVVKHILGQIDDAVNKQRSDLARDDCSVENHITVSVPPQELDTFNDRTQMLIQQNSFLLLEQINTLFTFKLRSLKQDIEKIVKRRSNALENKIDLIMEKLGIEIEDDDIVATTEDPASIESSVFPDTVEPEVEPVVEPEVPAEPEPEPEPITEPEPEPTAKPEPASEESTVFPGMVDAAATPSPAAADTTDEDETEETDDEVVGFVRTPQPQSPASKKTTRPLVTQSGFGFLRPMVSRNNNRGASPTPYWRDRVSNRATYRRPSY